MVAEQGLSVRLVCAAFGISETCYRYEAKASKENTQIENRVHLSEERYGIGSLKDEIHLISQGAQRLK